MYAFNICKIIHWRVVPVDNSVLGEVAKEREPLIKQVNASDVLYAQHVCHFFNVSFYSKIGVFGRCQLV